MRLSLIDILCCPVCKSDFKLSVEKQDGEEIVSGSLYCLKCDHYYQIVDTIPNLLPPEQVGKS